jgi:hypothetical protein
MAPRKMAKEAGESTNLNTDVLSDTSPRAIDTVKSWTHVFDILEHELINFPEDSGDVGLLRGGWGGGGGG